MLFKDRVCSTIRGLRRTRKFLDKSVVCHINADWSSPSWTGDAPVSSEGGRMADPEMYRPGGR